MIDINEIDNTIEEINNEKLSYNSKRKTGLLFGLVNFGLSFTPIGLYTIPVSIGLIAYGKYLDKQRDKINEKDFNTAINIENYKNQMDFLKKLSKSIDEHYKKSFKDYKYVKEEEICKHIKLNSENQMDSKLISELKTRAEKLLKTQEGNHYNILVLGRSGVGKSTLINVVLNLKGEEAAK